jgi:hypothetical protein
MENEGRERSKRKLEGKENKAINKETKTERGKEINKAGNLKQRQLKEGN